MPGNKVEIEVSANTGQAVTGVGQVGTALDGVSGKQGAVGTAAVQSADKQTGAHKRIRDGVDSISSQLDGLKTQLLGLVGVGVGTQAIKDLAAMSDSYKNLEARIKLTTGEGKAFDSAFEGVFAVAKRTSSAVEETGTLFTKLAEAGKALGVSQADALKLTETINQSIQLSGGSADAAKASITQLIQGMQSGVLRGDEFNSVMEQSPRLAKAMADGLGVPIGELRKLAEEGKLTSATVIGALQKQSDVIQGEFGKLPQTVGRAMQNLTTEFTKFIGETDKAHGYSTTLAKGIELLSGNLSTVATAMIHAGQVFGAFKALNLAADFLGLNKAMADTAATTVTNTAATSGNTAAKRSNAVATAAQGAASAQAVKAQVVATEATAVNTAAVSTNTAAQVANALAAGKTGAASGAASAAAGLFGGGLAAITRAFLPLAALDIALNFRSYGTYIGEAAAKLMGYKDRTEELAKAEKEAARQAEELANARKKQALADKEAADARFGLTKRGAELVSNFDELIKKGDSTAEAIGKIGKDFDLASLPGIKDAAGVLDKLAADGKISAGQFQKAWAEALKGEDLAVFQVKAEAALKGTGREAERLAQILDASVREAIKRTGLDFDVIAGGMGKASRSAINDTEAIIKGLDGLKKQGVDTAQTLTASIGKSINTADGQKAIEAVKQQIESLRKVLGDKLTDGLLDQAAAKAKELTAALNGVKPGIQDVAEAMKLLGITSDESLKKTAKTSQEAYELMRQSGTSSARELSAAFAKSAADAIAANNGIAPSWVQAQAGAKGFELAVDSAGKTILRAMSDGGSAVDALGQKVRESTADFEKQAAALDAINARYGQSKADRDGKYSRPGEGPNNSVLTKDDMKGVDNTGLDSLLQKRQAGTLSQGDLTTAEGVFKAAAANLDVYQKNSHVFSLEGAKSINDNYNASRALLEQIRGLAVPKAVTPTSATAPATTNTYLVKIDLGNGRTSNVNVASANDAQTLISALQSAKSAAGA